MSEEIRKEAKKIRKQLRNRLMEIKAADDSLDIFFGVMDVADLKYYECILFEFDEVCEQLRELESSLRCRAYTKITDKC